MEKRVVALVFSLLFFVVLLFGNSMAANTASVNNSTLTVWTNGTSDGSNLTAGSYSGKSVLMWQFYFNANYTNSSGHAVNSTNGNGNCTIQFNETGIFSNPIGMYYGGISKMWWFSQNFSYKGALSFMVSCNSSYGNVTNLTDGFSVLNTPPYTLLPSTRSARFTQNNLSEFVNVSQFFSDDDRNDFLGYYITAIEFNGSTNPSSYPWLILNRTSSILSHTVTTADKVGRYNLSIMINDSAGNPASMTLNLNISASTSPSFSYICNNERSSLVENAPANCLINMSYLSLANLTAVANESWFKFNSTSSNLSYVIGDSSGLYSAFVNFTPSVLQVGNWSVNISIVDSSNSLLFNSSIVRFYIGYINHSVGLAPIANITSGLYNTSSSYSFRVNATDNNLLIPDKSVYNEQIRFNSTLDWVNVTSVNYFSGATNNNMTALITIYPTNKAPGSYYPIITAFDANNYSISSRVFNVTILGNSPPIWSSSMVRSYNSTQGASIYLNLSGNVTDSDGDVVNFSSLAVSDFPSFLINFTTGIINISLLNEDVGNHSVTLLASDGKANASSVINFSIANIADLPSIGRPISTTNAYVSATTSNVVAQEDNATTLLVYVYDDDFRITDPSSYHESLTNSYYIQGNSSLFTFSHLAGTPSAGNNFSVYISTFTPKKADVGNYTVYFNVTDGTGYMDTLSFNLSILSVNHPPVIADMGNISSVVGRLFDTVINVSDVEDGNQYSGNITYNLTFLQGRDFVGSNGSAFNRSTGTFNVYFNSTQSGSYRLNLTVNDSTGRYVSSDFWLFVYDNPFVRLPSVGSIFNLKEGTAYNLLLFAANHTVRDNLSYYFIIDGNLNTGISGYGNGSNVSWAYTPGYNDESYGLFKNLSLFVFNPTYPDLNNSASWNLNISHTASPLTLNANISNSSKFYSESFAINLSNYFSYLDYFDGHYNSSLNFTIRTNVSSSLYSASVSSNWMLSISASSSLSMVVNITADNGINQLTTNNFEIQFLTPSSGNAPTSNVGGGGGTTIVTKPIGIKLVLPEPVKVDKRTSVSVPVTIINKGTSQLNGVHLSETVYKNGNETNEVSASFDRNYFAFLAAGQKENVSLLLTVESDMGGKYEINVSALSDSPVSSDWGSVYLEFNNGASQEDRLTFAEELILGNPECLELKEALDEAKVLMLKGDVEKAAEATDKLINACKRAIEGVSGNSLIRMNFFSKLVLYIVGAFLGVILIIIIYYSYRRIRLKRALDGY